jgi:chemotaxis methyl-accepting protein methylase/FixJ family two-component response regulator/signal transduction histidine kinase
MTGPMNAVPGQGAATKVVAVGASSGGLDAVTKLLEALEPMPDMAFVLIQHLDPDHESLLVELLTPHTALQVVQITSGTAVRAGTLHIMPPGQHLRIKGGVFEVVPPAGHAGARLPFDGFLTDLAKAYASSSACIVLSGNGGDGSVGLAAIAAAGGRVFVQLPDEAANPAMPLSAVATGLAELVAPVADIAHALRTPRAQAVAPLTSITALLEARTGKPVSAYKPTTVVRRIARRMALCGIKAGRLDLYLDLIRQDAAELDRLAGELLIHVTSFFRDPSVFDVLEKTHVPDMLAAHDKARSLRVWIAGCSTGEEAYSLAIVLQDAIAASGLPIRLQVFASDVDPLAIKIARAGRYPAAAISGLSAARKARYFTKDGDGVRVESALRNAIVFAVQDILTDPPFGQMDLISCRNLLIYLNPQAQAKVLDVFDFALQKDGFLLLGQAESVSRRFVAVNPANRLFKKDTGSASTHPDAAGGAGRSGVLVAPVSEIATLRQALHDADQARRLASDEALAVSEEYQSANEELLTSKEELQALNEELAALNSQLQEALSQQRTLAGDLQNVLYSTDIATIFLDPALNIRFFTPATSLVFNVIQSDIGRPLSDLRALADDAALYSDAMAVVAGARPIEAEVSAHAAHGQQPRWFLRRIMPYHSKSATSQGVVVTYSDITEQRQTAQALEEARSQADQASLAKSRFLATASHDMRQPLQTLTLLLALLNRGPDRASAQRLLDRFGRILGSMGTMLDALLGINQIEAGTIVPEVVALRANHVLEELYDAFGDTAVAAGVRLQWVATGLWVKSDGALLDQILRNLVANAIKFTPGGRVLMGCRRDGDSVRFEIWDTGEGIDAGDLQTMFGEYVQLPSSTDEPGQAATALNPGLGLGLAIVRRLAGLLGHDVMVRSWPGRGSVFSIKVPKAAAGHVAAADDPTPIAAPDSPTGLHGLVLIVDDDPDVRDTLEVLIKSEGYSVITARDGLAALAACASLAITPDILLADYNLPGSLDGLALKPALETQVGEEVTTIILSGDISHDALRRFKESGVAVMLKPVSADMLFQGLSKAVAARKSAVDETSGPTSRKLTVCVIDDSQPVRETLQQMLEADGFSVACFAGADEYLEVAGTMQDQLLILDQGLTGMSGLELLAHLGATDSMWPCIMLSGRSDQRLAVKAMQAGALTVMVKPVSRHALLTEIAAALSASADSVRTREARAGARALLDGLTPRQVEILDRLLLGQPNKIIADDLSISQRTVENHRAAIMVRTATKSLPALARLAMLARQPVSPKAG